jgi:hypothetical protein
VCWIHQARAPVVPVEGSLRASSGPSSASRARTARASGRGDHPAAVAASSSQSRRLPGFRGAPGCPWVGGLHGSGVSIGMGFHVASPWALVIQLHGRMEHPCAKPFRRRRAPPVTSATIPGRATSIDAGHLDDLQHLDEPGGETLVREVVDDLLRGEVGRDDEERRRRSGRRRRLAWTTRRRARRRGRRGPRAGARRSARGRGGGRSHGSRRGWCGGGRRSARSGVCRGAHLEGEGAGDGGLASADGAQEEAAVGTGVGLDAVEPVAGAEDRLGGLEVVEAGVGAGRDAGRVARVGGWCERGRIDVGAARLASSISGRAQVAGSTVTGGLR